MGCAVTIEGWNGYFQLPAHADRRQAVRSRGLSGDRPNCKPVTAQTARAGQPGQSPRPQVAAAARVPPPVAGSGSAPWSGAEPHPTPHLSRPTPLRNPAAACCRPPLGRGRRGARRRAAATPRRTRQTACCATAPSPRCCRGSECPTWPAARRSCAGAGTWPASARRSGAGACACRRAPRPAQRARPLARTIAPAPHAPHALPSPPRPAQPHAPRAAAPLRGGPQRRPGVWRGALLAGAPVQSRLLHQPAAKRRVPGADQQHPRARGRRGAQRHLGERNSTDASP